MKKTLLAIVLLVIGFTNSYATHNRAGEITYKHISGLTYGITVTTYTNTLNTQADRCEVVVYFDCLRTDSAVAPRINGPHSQCPATADGQMIPAFPNTKYNVYYITHTFSGPGDFCITMDDPNRNANTDNIPNSVQTSFSLYTELVINPFLGYNDSPVLYSYPLDNACVGQCFYHNTIAVDPNGDSLYFKIDTCRANGLVIPGWFMPPNMNQGSINHSTGDLAWCSPPSIGQYSIAIRIQEWRRLQGSPNRFYIGSVLRDMQIIVGSCTNNPPQIGKIDDTCVVAGSNLHFVVSATDAENNGLITLEANGGSCANSCSLIMGSTC